MRTHSLLSAMLAASLLTAGRAQNAPAEVEAAQPPVAPASAVVIQGEAPGGVATRDQDTLSVDFPDEDIRNILRNVADLFELNIVIPDTLQGKTSIKLRDVTWRQIFQVVLSPVGYTYAEEGNIIKVVSQESLAQEPVSTEVFILNYARAQDIRPSIEPLVDTASGGRVITDARSNALVISERPSRMGRIRVIIEELDKATEQVMIESKFVEVTDRDVRELGLDWTVNAGAGVGQDYSKEKNRSSSMSRESGDGQNTAGRSSNVSLGPDTVSSTTSSSSSTFTPPAIPGPVVFGPTSATTSSTQSVTATSSVERVANQALNSLNAFTNSKTGDLTTTVFSNYEFGVVLRALETNNNTKLVSNPTVVTLNNTEANINIGEEYPIPNYTYNQERGTFEVSGFTYRPIGINLKVTPQVNSRGFIKLTIEPEVSSRSGTTTFGGAGGAEIPIIATRKSKTQISLRDGYTMGIGGLIENNTQDGQNKLPILGSIPGLGRLFRSDTKNVTSRNLLIFITAKTVNAEGAPIEEIFDPRAVRSMGLRRDELPGYRDGSDPFAPAVPDTQKK